MMSYSQPEASKYSCHSSCFLVPQTSSQLREGLKNAGVFVDENGTTIFKSTDNIANMSEVFVS